MSFESIKFRNNYIIYSPSIDDSVFTSSLYIENCIFNDNIANNDIISFVGTKINDECKSNILINNIYYNGQSQVKYIINSFYSMMKQFKLICNNLININNLFVYSHFYQHHVVI